MCLVAWCPPLNSHIISPNMAYFLLKIITSLIKVHTSLDTPHSLTEELRPSESSLTPLVSMTSSSTLVSIHGSDPLLASLATSRALLINAALLWSFSYDLPTLDDLLPTTNPPLLLFLYLQSLRLVGDLQFTGPTVCSFSTLPSCTPFPHQHVFP